MQPPTWKEVGVPDLIVKTLHQFSPTYAMDCLVSQLVYHNSKKLVVTYSCDHCTYTYIPERANEEVSQCPECQSKKMRCQQSVKFNSEKKIPYYSRSGGFILGIANQMLANFSTYFKSAPSRDMDWEWHNNLYHVAFAGGETASGQFPRIAIARAALLTPYLWDTLYDWKNNCPRDKAEQKLISSLLTHFMLKKEQ